MRKYLAVLTASLLLLFILPELASVAWAGRNEYVFTEEKNIVLEPGASISVQNLSGNIAVTGWDRDYVLIKSTKRIKANSREEAEEWTEKVEIIVEKDGQDLTIEAKRPQDWSESVGSLLKDIFQKKPSVEVDFDIQTPRDVQVEISSVSGDISIENIGGDVTVDVVSGDLEIHRAGADVSINTVSGDMVLEDIADDLEVDAVSGDMEIDKVSGDVRIDVTSGDIIANHIVGDFYMDGTSGDVDIRDVHGDIHIDVTSGDISVAQKSGSLWIDTSSGDVVVKTTMEKSGRYQVETSSGQIIFRIPSSASGTVDMETSGGKITAKLPMTIESMSRTHLVGVLGTGEGEILLSTSGGDIDLLPLD